MAKELPYFKYFPSEWVTGDITLMDMETQGVFINICSFYWMRNCSICLANVKQRFSKHEASIQALLKQEIIKVDSDDNIIINFLDEQMNEFVNVSEKRAKAGAKGGKANAKQMLSKTIANVKQMPIYKDKDKDNILLKKQNEFKEDVRKFKGKYDDQLLKDFFLYWSEPTKQKDKIRKELEKTWDTERRLNTWFNRSNK